MRQRILDAEQGVSGRITVQIQKVGLIKRDYCPRCEEEDHRHRTRDEERGKL